MKQIMCLVSFQVGLKINVLTLLFILCISPIYQKTYAQTSINFSSYFGGDGSDVGAKMIVENGETHILASTTSTDFPVTNGSTHSGSSDILYVKLDNAGNISVAAYVGGSGAQEPVDFAVFNNEIFILCTSDLLGFPVTDGSSFGGGDLDFVYTKLDNLGNIVFATYLGGSGGEKSAFFEVSNGELYFYFHTAATDYPVTDGSTHAGSQDLLVMKKDNDGNTLFSTFIGGSGSESSQDMQVVGDEIYLLATSSSTDFPVTDGSSHNGSTDLVVLKLDVSGNISLATYIGGSSNERGGRFAVSGDKVYIIGTTSSTNFPVTDGSTFGGSSDLVYIKLNSLGNIEVASYHGGNSTESGVVMELVNDEMHIFGTTRSSDFPVTNTSNAVNGEDLFYSKFSNSGVLLYSITFGGTDKESAREMVILNNEVHFFGHTGGNDYPVTNGLAPSGSNDFFYTKLDSNQEIEFSTFLGGSNSETSTDMSVIDDNIYLLGHHNSADFPTTNGSDLQGSRSMTYSILNLCPTGYLGNNTVTPSSQNVCQNGLVAQIVGEKIAIPANSLPTLYRNGVASAQNEIVTEYQWQEATSVGGPWTNIPGAIQQNYTPNPIVVSRYFRRIASTTDCCGNTIINTSDVASVLVSGNLAPTVDAGGVFNTCPGNTITIGGSPSATGGTTPYSYEWMAGASSTIISTVSNPGVTPSGNGSTIYTLTVTDNSGCQQIDQAIVNAYETYAGPDVGFCEGTTGVQIGGSPVAGLAGVTYSWSPVTNLSCTDCAQPIASPLVATPYTVTLTIPVTGGGTCSTTDNVLVSPVNAPTTPDFAGPDVTICLGSTATLGEAAEAGFGYTWAPGNYLTVNNTAQTTFQPGSLSMPSPNPITYYVTAEKEGCVFVDETVAAVIEARAGDDGCGPRYLGEPDRTPNIMETFSWTKISGTGNFTGVTDEDRVPVSATPSGSTTFQLDVTYNAHTCTDQVIVPPCGCTLDVDVEAPFDCPDFGLNGGDVKLIARAADIFSSDPDLFTYSWSPADGLSATTGREVYLTDDVQRTYTVTMTSPFDPTFMCTDNISVNNPAWSLPVFNSSDETECSGVPIQIGDSPVAGYAYEWTGESLSSTTVSNPVATALATTNYFVTVTDVLSGCITKDTSTVTVPDPIANAGPDLQVCDNGVVTLGSMTSQPNTSYSWSPAGANWQNGTDQNSPAPDVLVAINTSFTVTVTDTPSGCTSTDDMEVIVGTPIAPFTLPGLSYCPSDVTPLTLGSTAPGGGGYMYSWSPASLVSNASMQMPTVNDPKPGSETTFTLLVTNSDGCEQTGTQTITPNDTPFTAGSSQSICTGETIALGSAGNPTGGGINYSWNPTIGLSSSTSPNPTFSTSTVGTYDFTLTKTEGTCTNTSTVSIIVNEYVLPAMSSTTVCQGTCVEIGTSSEVGVQYYWSPTTNLSDPNIANPVSCVNASTTYTLTAIGLNGCPDTGEVLVGVNPVQAPTVTIPTVTECLGSTGVTFNPGVSPMATYDYVWSPNDGTLNNIYSATPEVFLTGVGSKTYDVTVTNTSNGCSSSGTAYLTVENCACTIENITLSPSGCDPSNSTYDLTVMLTYNSPPAGDLTINVDGTDYNVSPTGISPETFTINNLSASGNSTINVNATFVGDNSCTISGSYSTPSNCICDINITSIALDPCVGSNPGTTDLTATISWENAPGGEDILVTLADSSNLTINVSGGLMSPQSITFNGITADGSANNLITAAFISTGSCSTSSTYNLPCNNCNTGQFTIDWGAIGFIEDVNNPIHEDTYIDNVNYEANPYHGFATSTGGITANWQSQSFSDISGSGIGITLHFSPNPIGSIGGSSTTGPNLYGGTGGSNPDCQVTGNDALRMVNDKQGTITLFTAILTFDEPVIIDEYIIGSMSQIASNFENGLIRAFTGPMGSGTTVPASTYQNISDLSDDSSLIHNLGGSGCSTVNLLANIELDAPSSNNTYHFIGKNNQSSGHYGRVKFGWSTPVQSIAFSTWMTASSNFDDRTYTSAPHSVIFAPLTFSRCNSCNLDLISDFEGTCADNGTVSNGTDDYLTFSIAPNGTGIGAGYSVTATQGGNPITITLNAGGAATGISYGSSTIFRTPVGTAGGGDITVTVTDSDYGTCNTSFTLTDPATATLAAIGSDPTTCAGTDGQIEFTFSNVPDGSYTINYLDGAMTVQSFDNVSVTSNMATVSGLAAGIYNNLNITISGCTSTEDIDITLSDPPLPACSISGGSSVFANSTGNIFVAPTGMTSYLWSISGNGTINGSNSTDTVRVDADLSGSFTLTLDIEDAKNCMNSCNQLINIESLIDLSIDKSVDNVVADIGDTVIFTLIVQNEGPSTGTGIQVTDQLPSGLSYISDDGGDYMANIWTVNDLVPGASDTLLIEAEVLASGSYQNDAEITAANETDVDSEPGTGNMSDDYSDGIEDDDEDSVEITPTLNFDLALDKHLSNGQASLVDFGDDICYTIVINNQGDITADEIEICDLLPKGLIISPNDTSNWSGSSPDTLYHTLPGTIAPGDSDSVTIKLRVLYGGSGASLVNTAEIFGNKDSDGNGVIDEDSVPNNGEEMEDDIADESITLLSHDPSGFIYCDKTGLIVTGGTISVTGPSGIPNDPTEVDIIADGSNGYYEWFAIGPVGNYSITYNHPNGHAFSPVKTPTAPLYMIPTAPPNITLGSDTLSGYLSDTTFSNNPYYLNFEIEPGDAFVLLNNIPVTCVFLGSIICEDDDLNETDDGNEPAFANVMVRLYDCADTINPIDTTLTDVNGQYRFDGLASGDYRVQVVAPSGYRIISTQADTVGADGFMSCVNLNLGECDTTKSVCFRTIPYDWGDLPDGSSGTGNGDYQTTSANNGPSHQIITGLKFGSSIDEESDGQESTAADGDGNDEDGFGFPLTLNFNRNTIIRRPLDIMNMTGITAYLEGWIDWNGDGDFDDTGEMIVDLSDDGAGNFGLTRITITVPGNAVHNQALGVRFRLSNTDNMTPYGQINSGEVEDYLISVGCPLEQCLPTHIDIDLGGR